MLEIEVQMVSKFVLKISKAPVLIYAFHHDDDNLPMFFPILYPSSLEPIDCERYVGIIGKLRQCREKLHLTWSQWVDVWKDHYDFFMHQKPHPKKLKICLNGKEFISRIDKIIPKGQFNFPMNCYRPLLFLLSFYKRTLSHLLHPWF